MGWTLRRDVRQNIKSNRLAKGQIIWSLAGHNVLSGMKGCRRF